MAIAEIVSHRLAGGCASSLGGAGSPQASLDGEDLHTFETEFGDVSKITSPC